jgi:hypothetical protein
VTSVQLGRFTLLERNSIVTNHQPHEGVAVNWAALCPAFIRLEFPGWRSSPLLGTLLQAACQA